MTTAVAIIRDFYAALAAGDAPRALGLMADDIEWITMWHYKVDGRGPNKVAEGPMMPLMKEWKEFELVPTEYIVEGNSVYRSAASSGRTARPARRSMRATRMFGRWWTGGSRDFANSWTRWLLRKAGNSWARSLHGWDGYEEMRSGRNELRPRRIRQVDYR